MSLLIGFDTAGVTPSVVSALDDIIAPLQTWVGVQEGLNAQLESTISAISGKTSFVPTGAVMLWTTATAPNGYLICNGAAASRTTYATLFAVIGTTYGTGDGTTTFNLPELRQRFPLGVAASGTGSTLAGTGGTIDHTHTGPSHTHTGPSHTHTVDGHTHTNSTPTTSSDGAHTHTANTDVSATGTTIGAGSVTASHINHVHTLTTTSDGAHTHTVTVPTTGSTSPGTDAQGTGATGAAGTGATGTGNPPFLALHFIIKT